MRRRLKRRRRRCTLTRPSAPASLPTSLLSAAYHNLAVQQERLGSSKGHVRSYRAAVQQARKGGAKSQMASFMGRLTRKAAGGRAGAASARPPSSPASVPSRAAHALGTAPVGSGSASAARHGGGARPSTASRAARARPAAPPAAGAAVRCVPRARSRAPAATRRLSASTMCTRGSPRPSPLSAVTVEGVVVPPPGVGDGGGGGGATHRGARAPRASGRASSES